MKTISAALTTFLVAAEGNFPQADLITITLPNGQILNVLSGTNQDIVYQGITYYASRYGSWERGPYTNKADFKPSSESMELRGLIPETVLFPGTSTPMMQVLLSGVLAGSLVNVQTLFWPAGGPYTAGISMGTMQLTTGQIGGIKMAGRSQIVCEVFDLLYILNRPVPPFSIQSGCRHNVFDPGCTLNVANFLSTNVPLDATSTSLYLNLNVPARVTGVPVALNHIVDVGNVIYFCIQAGTPSGSPIFNASRGAVTTDGTAKWVSYNLAYVQGYVLFTSGQNAGLRGSVKAMALTAPISGLIQLQLLKYMPFPVAAGDTVQLVPGCDKSIATCSNAFNNIIHFGGMPFVPNPEVAQ